MQYSLQQAAKVAHKAKVTILTDIKAGRLSAHKRGNAWRIDASELHRVYGNGVDIDLTRPADTKTPQTELLEQEVKHLKELMAIKEKEVAKQDKEVAFLRDRLEQEQQKTTLLLSDGGVKKGWWQRIFK